jgi:hypothetical protein
LVGWVAERRVNPAAPRGGDFDLVEDQIIARDGSLDGVLAEAERLVSSYWPEISCVADALLKRDLTGTDIRRLLLSL